MFFVFLTNLFTELTVHACTIFTHLNACMYKKSFGESTLCDNYTILVTVNLKTAAVLGY